MKRESSPSTYTSFGVKNSGGDFISNGSLSTPFEIYMEIYQVVRKVRSTFHKVNSYKRFQLNFPNDLIHYLIRIFEMLDFQDFQVIQKFQHLKV